MMGVMILIIILVLLIMRLDGVRGPHSQLGDLHHGQAVRKAVFGRVFRLPERRSLSVTCENSWYCRELSDHNVCS